MFKSKFAILLFGLLIAAPQMASALEMPMGLQMPQNGTQLAEMFGVNAQSYVVEDVNSGQMLISNNSNMAWPPASLTKLVTALVVLDTKPRLYNTVAMTEADQAAGWCDQGGACIKAAPGVRFTVDGLFHAALMPSANNAANALARSTGLPMRTFVDRMNQKAASLGATNTHFNEPTGMDPANQITARDYAKIVTAAFANPYLKEVANTQRYLLRSTNNWRYTQTIQNTDKLLADADVQMLGAKTGYLDESRYNFASLLKYDGQKLAVVVLGEPHLYTAFAETKLLASLANQAEFLAYDYLQPMVLGTSTGVSMAN